jgi:hypothetical protein
MKRESMEQRRAVLMAALVAEYGEGSVITRKQMEDLWKKDKEKYPNYYCIYKNPIYKVGKNKFIVTTQEDVAAVVSKTAQNMSKLETVRETKLLPKETRTDAKKLAKKVSVAKTVKKAKEKIQSINTMDGFENDEEDINQIMKTLN